MGNVNSHSVLTMMLAEETPSKELYDKAIRDCGRSGLVHFQAYMYERCGLHLMNVEKDEGSGEWYLTQASHLYQDWGAWGKVDQMRNDYEFLASTSSTVGSSSRGSGSIGGGGGGQVLGSSSLKGVSRYEKRLPESLKTYNIRDSVDKHVIPPAQHP